MESSVIEKYSKLTHLDKANMGTLCKVINDNDEYVLYVQVSSDEQKPQWIPVGEFLEKIFREFIYQKDFLDECIRLYNTEPHNPFKNIIDLMNKSTS